MNACIKFVITILAILTVAIPTNSGEVLDRVMERKVLVNAVEGEYPPFNSIGDNNEIVGFDIDVAKEVAKRMGVELQNITRGWDVITAGHWANRWDIAISSMANTKTRQEVLDFPAAYYFVGEPLFHEEASIAIDKGDPEFGAKIKEIIEAMRADDTLKRLSEERFGVDITLPPAGT